MKKFIKTVSAIVLGVLVLVSSPSLGAEEAAKQAVFTLLPGLQKQATAEIPGNILPTSWPKEEFDVMVQASWMEEKYLFRTADGEKAHTLSRIVYKVNKIIEGSIKEKHIMFFIEKEHPVSGINTTWPFPRTDPLIFSLRRGPERWVIMSIDTLNHPLNNTGEEK